MNDNINMDNEWIKKYWQIPKEQSGALNVRTANTIA